LLEKSAITTPPFLKMNSTSYGYVLTYFCINYYKPTSVQAALSLSKSLEF
jgi:hypothetical protein